VLSDVEKEDLQLEEELVRKAQHSRQAFGELYRCYYAGIFGYTLNRVADVQLALDITSATFFKALNRFSASAGAIFPSPRGFTALPPTRSTTTTGRKNATLSHWKAILTAWRSPTLPMR
jgi:hypothetical protein